MRNPFKRKTKIPPPPPSLKTFEQWLNEAPEPVQIVVIDKPEYDQLLVRLAQIRRYPAEGIRAVGQLFWQGEQGNLTVLTKGGLASLMLDLAQRGAREHLASWAKESE
jgi:hypothetical protein